MKNSKTQQKKKVALSQSDRENSNNICESSGNRVHDTVCTPPRAGGRLSRQTRQTICLNFGKEPRMARQKKSTPEVEKVRPYLEGVAKNLVDRLYGPGGPPWGTKLSELEDVVVAIRE